MHYAAPGGHNSHRNQSCSISAERQLTEQLFRAVGRWRWRIENARVLNVHIYLYKHKQFNGIAKVLPSALSDITNRVSLIGLVVDTILVALWKARTSSKQALAWSSARCGHSRKCIHYTSPLYLRFLDIKWWSSIVAAAILLAGASGLPAGEATDNFHLGPNTVVLDGTRLLETKLQLLFEPWNKQLKTALGDLTTQADSWLSQGPWSVTTSPKTPPGGDLHDYASQAPYYWPSNTTNGCPYINRDGVVNPETLLYTDHANRGTMFQASYILSLAWYYTGKEAYGKHAGDILRTWFLANDTRMNPNLNHAQIIPCQNTGRSIGIIDFSQEYTSILDTAAILATGAPGWTQSDVNGFHEWNVEFLDWLVNSPFGIEELAAKNNHGTFASMQIAGIALFVGNKTLAKQQVLDTETRLNDYVTANGSQPLELVRTRSWHYSTFDLVAYTRLAAIGQHVGVDLWNYKGPQGQSINGAVDFIVPAATNSTPWPYQELEFLAYGATDVVHAAADAGNKIAKAAVSKLQPPPGGDLWLLRPAAEQLDAISVSS